MEISKHLAEVRPEMRLIFDELPPINTKLWMITKYGSGFAGPYHPENGVVAWGPMPKLSPESKRRLMALEAAGHDVTKRGNDGS